MKGSQYLGILWILFAIVILVAKIKTGNDYNIHLWSCIIIANIYFSKTVNNAKPN
jgi:hypothetical protein